MRRFKWLLIVSALVLLAASPPYNLDISHPADNDIQSVFPANERTFRDNLNSYINTEHDIATGYHQFQELTTSAKNGLTSPPKGMLVYDTTLGALQINTGTAGTPVWTNVIGTGSFVTSVNVLDATNGGLNCTGGPITTSGSITCNQKPSDLLTKTTPVAADSISIMDSAASNAAKTATITSVDAASGDGNAAHFKNGTGTYITVAGTLSAGTTNTKNPIGVGTATTQAHGLGATPAFVIGWLECITADQGYSVGDRVSFAALEAPVTPAANDAYIGVQYNATNTILIIGPSLPFIPDPTHSSLLTPTAAKWKAVVVPYKIN